MTKVCNVCGQTKPITDFYKNGLYYRPDCKACKSARDSLNHCKRRASDPEAKRKHNETSSAWQRNNREAYNTNQRAYQNNKYATDSEFRMSEIIRKQLRRSAGSLSAEEWNNILKHFEYACAYCGKTHEITMEHIIPISKGGLTSVLNIVPACSTCNSSKNNKDMLEWYTAQSFFSEYRLERILSYLEGGENR